MRRELRLKKFLFVLQGSKKITVCCSERLHDSRGEADEYLSFEANKDTLLDRFFKFTIHRFIGCGN